MAPAKQPSLRSTKNVVTRTTSQGDAPEKLRSKRLSGVGTKAPIGETAPSKPAKDPSKAAATKPVRRIPPPEECLRKAMGARTPTSRARHAKAGLATPKRLDPTVHAMLMRQLYLSLYETRRFEEALAIAEQGASLGVLPDILHHDAARAALAGGRLDGCIAHLRQASRLAPGSRRSQHYWYLGGALYLASRFPDAISALTRAVRWSTREKPLYRAHLALARLGAGEKVPDLADIAEALAHAPCGQGYGRFVLGQIAFTRGDWVGARRHLEAFVKRSLGSRTALGIALEGEISMARQTLAKMANN